MVRTTAVVSGNVSVLILLQSASCGTMICAARSMLVLQHCGLHWALMVVLWSVWWSVSWLCCAQSHNHCPSYAVVIVLTLLGTGTWPCYGQNYDQVILGQTQCPGCTVVHFRVSTTVNATMSMLSPSSVLSVVVRIVNHH